MTRRKKMNWMKKLILKLWRKPKRNTGFPAYKTDLKPSPPDDRDNIYAVRGLARPISAVADISNWCTPVKQQGKIGSCGSHAYATAIEILQNKKEPKGLAQLSELFHYYVVRSPDHMDTLPADSGQFLRDGAKVCAKEGISPEKLCPYDVNKFNEKPSAFAYSFAKWYRIAMYSRCWDVNSIRESIYDGKPVVFGITVQESIITQKTPDVTGKGRDIGGHALCAVGYDDGHQNPDGTRGAIRFINSWGTAWGSKGYGWISYSLLRKKLMDAWAVVEK